MYICSGIYFQHSTGEKVKTKLSDLTKRSKRECHHVTVTVIFFLLMAQYFTLREINVFSKQSISGL